MKPTFRILPVVKNEKLGPYYKITLRDTQMYGLAECGNFLMIGLLSLDPYLSRPFSFLELERETFSILVKVKGKGTRLLAKVKEGDKLKVLGPLGRAFCPPKTGVLIAGGIGIAPVYYQSRWMNGGILFYGTKRREELILVREFKNNGFQVKTITEEKRGMVTDLIESHIEELDGKQLFICGPLQMIKNVKEILTEEQIKKAHAYIEKRMGCGLGGCKSCAVKTISGYKLVCREGPIFSLREVKLG